MLFFIHFEVTVPADTPAETKEQLRQGEHARAIEFIEAGKIRRIWRPVGTADTCCIWEADSLEEASCRCTVAPAVSVHEIVRDPSR